MITLIAAAAYAAPCAAPTTAIELLAAIGTAETAFLDIDLEKYEAAQRGAETALTCLGEPLYPPDAAAWHRLEAMTAFVHKDNAASIAAYRSAFALQPDYNLPERIAPNGHPLRSWFDAARVLPASSPVPLPTSGVALYVDGTRAASYPADRPFVLQAMDPSGRIQATAPVAAKAELPTWATAASPAPSSPVAPTGAFGSASLTAVAPGTAFVVRDLHADDAYASSKATIVGLTCSAGPDMTHTDGHWWGGSATCNGNPFYFFKVAFDVTGTAAPAALVAFGSATAAEALYPPTQVILRDIADDDLYATQRSTLVGQTCAVSAELHRNDGAWYGGDVTCPGGTYYYFYKVAFDVAGEAYTQPSVASMAAGTSLVVQDIAPDDAYYPERAAIIGQSCTVASSLQPSEAGSAWYGGDVNCSNGSYYYFYKLKFTGGGSVALDRYAGSYVPKGSWVTIADVSNDDMFVSYKSALVGQVCQVKKEDLASSGDGWFSGTLKCGSEKLYFYQVGVIY